MIANLHIQASLREGKTYLNKCYSTPPFRIADITEDKRCAQLQLMLMSSSPGILDEDEYYVKINLDAHCSMQLHTQSYQRLFNMKKGASQFMEICVGEDSSFVYLPQPAVPHEHSIFTATNDIYLSNSSSLIWGEVLTCGRKGNGEVFQLAKYHGKTSIFINNKLVIKENLLLQPSAINPFSIGQLEGYTHQGSIIFLDEDANCNALNDIAFQYLDQQENISFGISAAPVNGIIIRILGYRAEQLSGLLQSVKNILTAEKGSLKKLISHVA
jgi:urease accessory protein